MKCVEHLRLTNVVFVRVCTKETDLTLLAANALLNNNSIFFLNMHLKTKCLHLYSLEGRNIGHYLMVKLTKFSHKVIKMSSQDKRKSTGTL